MTSRKIRHRQSDESGASAVEYGLLVAAIAAIIVAVVFAIGNATGALFDESCEQISTEVTAPGTNCPGGATP